MFELVVRMKNLSILFLGLTFLAGCKVDVGTNEAETFAVVALSENISFNDLSKNVLKPRCVECHSWATSESETQKRMVLGSPDSSEIYSKVVSGSMPTTGGSLSSKQIEMLRRYIVGAGVVASNDPILAPTYSSLKFHLLDRSCTTCHNSKSKRRTPFDTYELAVEHADEIISVAEFGTDDGEQMPPLDKEGKPKAPGPTKAILDAFKEWIARGKPNN
jgi:hypothetical protein